MFFRSFSFVVFVGGSLAARVLWRLHKDNGLASDSQLVSVDQLQEHVDQLSQEQLQQLQTDVRVLQDYWSYGSKQHSVEYISHIFGIVSVGLSFCSW